MVKITTRGNDRVDILIDGKIDADEMRRVVDDIEAELVHVEDAKVLYEFVNFEFPTLGAMAVKLAELPKMLRILKKFSRVALLVDREWMRMAAEFEGDLIPGLEIKGFELGATEEAEAWLERAE
ncbi:STAS/SEC14 domain-containing protein [Rubritalea tangerina]|uniref:STAS/SEC14 domain-containing protein n=2 Tax=Rubritalea tangerina TaxID=430798 RepID=A0ABW4Z6I0_9BACT